MPSELRVCPKTENILDARAHAIFVPVNAFGIVVPGSTMGAVCERWPRVKVSYQTACLNHAYTPGTPRMNVTDDNRILILAPMVYHPKNDYDALMVATMFSTISQNAANHNIATLAIPNLTNASYAEPRLLQIIESVLDPNIDLLYYPHIKG